jgi:predicted ribosome quality control (RQC) complex YloA/Tae2 family protein
MLSLRELRRAAGIMQEALSGATLRRVSQPDAHALVLTFEGSAGKVHLLISGKPEYARICLTDRPEATSSSGSFYECVRAHLAGGSLVKIEVSGADRQIGLCLQSRSGLYVLILSILGARSNVYLLDADRKLVHSMRPLEETRRELRIGEPWTNPLGAAPSGGLDRWEEVPDAQYLGAIGKTYGQLEQTHKAELLARRIEHALKKERAFLGRKAFNLREDLGRAREAESYRQQGELLKNVLHVVKPGDTRARATDYRTGEVFEIPLDPKLSPAANLESYFARYHKESRGVAMIERQLEDLVAAQGELDAIERQLKNALRSAPPDLQALQSLASQPGARRLILRHFPKRMPAIPPIKSAEKKRVPSRLLPKRYRTQDGLEIWVGRSDEGNDHLTTRLARGNDLFFHLEGYPGSHVVLRTEGRLDPPPGSLLDACELAVHFSKLKNAGGADIHVAPVKNVKKPKGAKPGLVYVRSGRTIRLRRDPKRLENILAARLDD